MTENGRRPPIFANGGHRYTFRMRAQARRRAVVLARMGRAPTFAVLVALALLASCTRKRELAEPDGALPQAKHEPTVTTVMTASVPGKPTDRTPRAFASAEGFGARARGGRGGVVCRVTTLARSGPGSLAACLDVAGPRTVIFDVSGTIEGPLEIRHGQVTLAGQTSPAGIVIKGGLVCDNVYDKNDCHDVVIRHLRLRGGAPDSLRIGGAHDVIVDHCSLAGAEDENVEITRSRNVTIQHSVIAEPQGDHYKWGGVLINYSKDAMPLDGITIHHTVWNGVAGRLPELSCEDNPDGPGRSNCTGHVASVELSNDVWWDVSDPIWFNRCTGTNQGNDCPVTAPGFGVHLNLVGNVMVRRSSSDPDLPFAEPALFATQRRTIHARDNVMMRGGRARDGHGGRAPPLPRGHLHALERARDAPRAHRRRLPAGPDGRAPRLVPHPLDRRAPAGVGRRPRGVTGRRVRGHGAPAATPRARRRRRRHPRHLGGQTRPRSEARRRAVARPRDRLRPRPHRARVLARRPRRRHHPPLTPRPFALISSEISSLAPAVRAQSREAAPRAPRRRLDLSNDLNATGHGVSPHDSTPTPRTPNNPEPEPEPERRTRTTLARILRVRAGRRAAHPRRAHPIESEGW